MDGLEDLEDGHGRANSTVNVAADRGEGVIVGMDMADGGLKGGEVMVDLVVAGPQQVRAVERARDPYPNPSLIYVCVYE